MLYKGTPWDSKYINGKFYKFDYKGEINIWGEEVELEEVELEVKQPQEKRKLKVSKK